MASKNCAKCPSMPWRDLLQRWIMRWLSLLFPAVYTESGLSHSNVLPGWALFQPRYDPYYPDTPVSCQPPLLPCMVFQILVRITGFHGPYSICGFHGYGIWYQPKHAQDNVQYAPCIAPPLPEDTDLHCTHQRMPIQVWHNPFRQCWYQVLCQTQPGS